MFDSGNEERPAIRLLLSGADLLPLLVPEAAASQALERVYVELDLCGQQAIGRVAQREEFVDRRLALLDGEVLRDLGDEQRVELGVARLVDPVEPQDVAEQRIEILVIAYVFDVVQLDEPLDETREQERRERRGGQHRLRDGFTSIDETALVTEALLNVREGAPHHLLMLDLFLGEPQQGPKPSLVPVHTACRVFENHRDDELFDEREEMAVAVAADLVKQPLFSVVEAGDVTHARDAVGEKGLREVEVAVAEDILDRPGSVQRSVETLGVAVVVGEHGPFLSFCVAGATGQGVRFRTAMEGWRSSAWRGLRSEKFGDELRGACRAVGRDGSVVDGMC